jgi:hypothetical protein
MVHQRRILEDMLGQGGTKLRSASEREEHSLNSGRNIALCPIYSLHPRHMALNKSSDQHGT